MSLLKTGILLFTLATVLLGSLVNSDDKRKETPNASGRIFAAQNWNVDPTSIQPPEDETVDAIINQFESTVDPAKGLLRHFNSTTLAFVTPWNNIGYSIAKTFGTNFDLVSPVWLQITPTKGVKGKFDIHGGHDIDEDWMRAVRLTNTKIVPRLLFEGWQVENYEQVLRNEYMASACSKIIRDFLLEHKFDGVVLEVWSQLGRKFSRELAHFLSHIASSLKASGLITVVVIPPIFNKYEKTNAFTSTDFQNLYDNVDYFSLMTYDYSNVMSPGPNSPLPWMEACVKAIEPTGNPERRSKILMGLNFYGMHYTGDDGRHILHSQLIQLLKNRKPQVEWNDFYAEHIFHFRHANKDQTVYYPTKSSLKVRIDLATRLHVGLAIWEIGQGPFAFYELF